MQFHDGGIGEEKLGLRRREPFLSLKISRKGSERFQPVGLVRFPGQADKEATIRRTVLEDRAHVGPWNVWAVGCGLKAEGSKLKGFGLRL